ncbi:MAG: hypothetical protein KatS3mg060_1992 [Dehalococcoidia bacterium]|nr:MAG: hypothetical protein KatS3mg060_1992 [Dehalococcoidia bacterium]
MLASPIDRLNRFAKPIPLGSHQKRAIHRWIVRYTVYRLTSTVQERRYAE